MLANSEQSILKKMSVEIPCWMGLHGLYYIYNDSVVMPWSISTTCVSWFGRIDCTCMCACWQNDNGSAAGSKEAWHHDLVRKKLECLDV